MSLTARLMERHFDKLLVPHGLSRLMWCILVMSDLYKITGPSQMAEYLGIDRTAISRVLRSMERAGLVERVTTKDDRRGREVRLTEEGSARLNTILPRAWDTTDYFASKLTDEETGELKRLLDKLADGEDGALPGL